MYRVLQGEDGYCMLCGLGRMVIACSVGEVGWLLHVLWVG